MRVYAESDPARADRLISSSFANGFNDTVTWIWDRIGQFACYALALNRALDSYAEDHLVLAALLLIVAVLLRGQMLQMHATQYFASVQRAAAFNAGRQ